MAYTLAEAAAAVGRNRSSVLRAIKAGKVSAVRDEVTAEWRIEPAELHRLYPVADAQGDSHHNAQLRNGHAQARNEAAEVEIRELRARLADKDAVIADLGRRLDAESEERRRLTAVLADQRGRDGVDNIKSTGDSPAPARRRRWWRFARP